MAFPDPGFEDHYDCDEWFAERPMEPADCLNMLPLGTEPVWFKNNPHEGDPYGLPSDVPYDS